MKEIFYVNTSQLIKQGVLKDLSMSTVASTHAYK